MTTYAVVYYLKMTGTVTSGPRSGMTFDGKVQDLATCRTIDDVRSWVQDHAAFFQGQFEIWSRQYDDSIRGFHHTYIETIEVGR